MSQKQVLIIGAGASGMTAAIFAARAGASVTLLDSMKKPGRKLLLTGNGKCNLTNLSPGLPGAYRSLCGSPSGVVEGVLRSFGVCETLSFFEELGLATRALGDLVYPRSGQAQTVLAALLRELERLRVKMKFNSKVTAISFDPSSRKWLSSADGWTYKSDALILCCGSKAAPSTGSDGSGYRLAEMANHLVTPVHAALTGLICADPALKQCAGARTRARVRLIGAAAVPAAPHGTAAQDIPAAPHRAAAQDAPAAPHHAAAQNAPAAPHRAAQDAPAAPHCAAQDAPAAPHRAGQEAPAAPHRAGQEAPAAPHRAGQEAPAAPRPELLLAEDVGEVQWTEYGISGIVVFQLSRFIPSLSDAQPLTVSIDLVPDMTKEEVAASMTKMIRHSATRITAKQLLESYTHDRVAAYLNACFSKSAASATELAALLKDVRLTVTGIRGFDHAQVCAGGVALDAIHPETLESKLAPGLFFAGELLDVDGPCGGYNLQWAWSSGCVAGRSAAR